MYTCTCFYIHVHVFCTCLAAASSILESKQLHCIVPFILSFFLKSVKHKNYSPTANEILELAALEVLLNILLFSHVKIMVSGHMCDFHFCCLLDNVSVTRHFVLTKQYQRYTFPGPTL